MPHSPYEYKDGDKFAGIDVEIAQAIAEKLGMELEIADVDFGAIIGGVQSGKYDLGMAGMTVSEDRKKSVEFSNTYATGVQVIIVKEDSQFSALEDFFELTEDGDFAATKSDVKNRRSAGYHWRRYLLLLFRADSCSCCVPML